MINHKRRISVDHAVVCLETNKESRTVWDTAMRNEAGNVERLRYIVDIQ